MVLCEIPRDCFFQADVTSLPSGVVSCPNSEEETPFVRCGEFGDRRGACTPRFLPVCFLVWTCPWIASVSCHKGWEVVGAHPNRSSEMRSVRSPRCIWTVRRLTYKILKGPPTLWVSLSNFFRVTDV